MLRLMDGGARAGVGGGGYLPSASKGEELECSSLRHWGLCRYSIGPATARQAPSARGAVRPVAALEMQMEGEGEWWGLPLGLSSLCFSF